ncbi:MAG: class I SAM-dependent methyltransferase [Candidatus Saccharimonadales bacterium]
MATSVETAVFDTAAPSFLDYEQQVHGRTRYELVWDNLTEEETILSEQPLNVLDVGVGSGREAARLASLGHQVVLLEESLVQQKFATERFADLSPDVRGRIDFGKRKRVFEDIRGQGGSFDLVLCHGVAMYQDDPYEFLRRVISFAKPDGRVSILEKGYLWALTNLIDEGRATEAEIRDYQDRQRIKNDADIDGLVYAFKSRQILQTLKRNGVEILQWSGVRMGKEKDSRWLADIGEAKFQEILAEERLDGKDLGKRGHGQMLHVIGRKT